jgi:hypothetical protein
MYSKPLALKLIRVTVFMAVMFIALQIAISFGVEKKSWFQRSWELVVGGSFGALAGLTFFLVVGAIGWVSGVLYGSVGLIGLMIGGALGGLGMGALANIIRNPQSYNFHWPILIGVLLMGWLLAKVLSSWVEKRANNLIPEIKPEPPQIVSKRDL